MSRASRPSVLFLSPITALIKREISNPAKLTLTDSGCSAGWRAGG